MENQTIEITETDYHEMKQSMLSSVLDFQEVLHHASHRGEILRSRDHRKKQLLEKRPESFKIRRLFAIQNSKIVGYGMSNYREIENDPNPEMIETHVEVHPEYRRQGIGSRLFAMLEEGAHELGRNKVEAWIAPIDGPEGPAFLKKFGFSRSIVEKCSRLYRDNINWDYIKTQEEKYRHLRDQYEFKITNTKEWVEWMLSDQSSSDEMGDFYTEVVNLIPREDIDMQDTIHTGEMVRESATSLQQRDSYNGMNIYVMDGNKIIAMSGTYYPNDPPVRDVGTGLTGVRKAYQRKGLASLLKCMIIREYTEKFPEFEYIYTENAQSNEGMLGINIKLGFVEAFNWEMWQRK